MLPKRSRTSARSLSIAPTWLTKHVALPVALLKLVPNRQPTVCVERQLAADSCFGPEEAGAEGGRGGLFDLRGQPRVDCPTLVGLQQTPNCPKSLGTRGADMPSHQAQTDR